MSHRYGLVLVLAAAVIAACDSGSDAAAAPGAAPGVVPGAPLPEAPGIAGDDRAVLINAFRQSTGRKMRARATMNVTDGPHPGTSSWIGEMVPPDLRRMDMTLPTGQHMQMVVAGERIWMRQGTSGPYTNLPAGLGMAGSAPEFERVFISHLEDGTATFTRAGTESLDGRPMTVYNLTSTMPGVTPGPDTTVTGRTWIGADGLAHKFEGDMQRPTAHVTILYEYDDSITITIPPT